MSAGVVACPACEVKNRVAATATGVPHCPKCGAALPVTPQTARTFNVQGIPTLLILRGGREVERQVGVLIGDALPQWIDRTIARSNV
jgi:hypothetical protein